MDPLLSTALLGVEGDPGPTWDTNYKFFRLPLKVKNNLVGNVEETSDKLRGTEIH